MSDFLAVDENLRAAMRFFGQASGTGEIRTMDGTVGMYSGLDYGVFNIGLLTRPVASIGGGLETRLTELREFFRARTLRWSFWLCEDMLDAALRQRERQIFSEFGMREISHPPGMIAPALLPPARSLPAIECRRVGDAATRAAFAEITSVSFDIPQSVAQAIYNREPAWKSEYRGFVGVVNRQAVSTATIVASGGVLGIYSVATLPASRRRGYGEALVRAAVADVRESTGISRLTLQSTEAGYALYKRMGFRDATRFRVYLTK
ncbi:MAG: GNAT family N-acetyltransferase [Bryobacteraceae bacterium]